MGGKANPRHLGKKINSSHLVLQVTKLIYEGIPDMQVAKVLKERYSFKVSVPSIASFRSNYYPYRIEELRKFSDEFQQEQTGRIQSFIDESLAQATQIKQDIQSISQQIAKLEKEVKYMDKFDALFKNAIDAYVTKFNPQDPKTFPHSESSPEENLLRQAVASMGDDGRAALSSYLSHHNPSQMIKLISALRAKLLDQREALVKIHKEVFKGYRNFSIMQEMTTLFEKYNGLIIEEFFPNRDSMDKVKYSRVRKKILSIYDEFQIKYQGVEAPADHGKDPEQAEAEGFAEKAEKGEADPKDAPKPDAPKTDAGMGGRKPSKSRQAQAEKEVDISDEEAKSIAEDAQKRSERRSEQGTVENLFDNLVTDIPEPDAEVSVDLDAQEPNTGEEKSV